MEIDTLSIVQYNTRKSQNIVTISLFQNNSILNIDIIALQEPWRNTRDTSSHIPRKRQGASLLFYQQKGRSIYLDIHYQLTGRDQPTHEAFR